MSKVPFVPFSSGEVRRASVWCYMGCSTMAGSAVWRWRIQTPISNTKGRPICEFESRYDQTFLGDGFWLGMERSPSTPLSVQRRSCRMFLCLHKETWGGFLDIPSNKHVSVEDCLLKSMFGFGRWQMTWLVGMQISTGTPHWIEAKI